MSATLQFHEDYDRRDEVRAGSARTFGLVFAAVFTMIGCWPLTGGGEPRIWALAVAVVFGIASLTVPRVLAPLNRLWFRFGMALHRIVSPIILGLLFYLSVFPTALLLRLFGKDLLRLRFEPDAKSYWIAREPPGPHPETMKNQF